MTHITPPQISEQRRKAIWTEAVEMRRFFDEATVREWTAEQFAEEINPQWLERLEQFGWCIHQDGEPADASAIWSSKPTDDEMRFLANASDKEGGQLIAEPLYRIKEQG